MNTFSKWNDFVNYSGSYQEKVLILKGSVLPLINPGNLRQL